MMQAIFHLTSSGFRNTLLKKVTDNFPNILLKGGTAEII
jgi:hypothetical protein